MTPPDEYTFGPAADPQRPFASEPGDWIPATELGQWRFDPAVGDAEIAAWDEILHPKKGK